MIGCALDLDENRIYFYLNGLGEEIGMSLACDKIDGSEGGVYPFISLEPEFNLISVHHHSSMILRHLFNLTSKGLDNLRADS